MESSRPAVGGYAAGIATLAVGAIIGVWLYLALTFGLAVALALLVGVPTVAALAVSAGRAAVDRAERRRQRPEWLERAKGLPVGRHRHDEVALRAALVGLVAGVA